jgi:hypothetical protein
MGRHVSGAQSAGPQSHPAPGYAGRQRHVRRRLHVVALRVRCAVCLSPVGSALRCPTSFSSTSVWHSKSFATASAIITIAGEERGSIRFTVSFCKVLYMSARDSASLSWRAGRGGHGTCFGTVRGSGDSSCPFIGNSPSLRSQRGRDGTRRRPLLTSVVRSFAWSQEMTASMA